MKKLLVLLFVLQVVVIPKAKWNKLTQHQKFSLVETLAVEWAKSKNCRRVGVTLKEGNKVTLELTCKDKGECI